MAARDGRRGPKGLQNYVDDGSVEQRADGKTAKEEKVNGWL